MQTSLNLINQNFIDTFDFVLIVSNQVLVSPSEEIAVIAEPMKHIYRICTQY